MLERLYNCTSEEYFALPYASNSKMKEAHKMLYTGDVQEEQEIPAYYFGSAVDAYLTDPEGIDTAKLSAAQRQTIIPMGRAIERNEIFQKLFSRKAGVEHQAVFIDKEFEIEFDGIKVTIPVKGKMDWWNPHFKFPGDLKTTACKYEHQFRKAAVWFDYDQQAALAMDLTKTDRFPIIAVSTANHATFNFQIKRGDPLYIAGRNKYLRAASSWWKLYGVQ